MKLVAAVAILALVFAVQKVLYRKNWFKGLETEMYFSRDYIECGENAELIEVISNRKFLPLPVLHLKFSIDKSLKFLDKKNSQVTDLYHKNELFSIMGYQRITRKLEFTGTLRGVVGVKNASIIVRDFFMTDTYARSLRAFDNIYIFPKKMNTEKFDYFYRGILGEIEAKRSMVEDSMTFRGVREYQPFDPFRAVNWKQSAKAGELMVNMYGYTTDCRVRILLNLDNEYMIETDKLLEEAISLVSSFADSLLKKGISVSVRTNGKDAEGKLLPEVPEGTDRKHSVTIDRMLTEICSSEGKDMFLDMIKEECSNTNRDLFYLIVSPYGKSDMVELLDALKDEGASIHLVVPCYDEYPYVSTRKYITPWEVPINV